MKRIMLALVAGVVVFGIAVGRCAAQAPPRDPGDPVQRAEVLDLRLKREKVEYAINDEKAAKAAAAEANSRTARDQLAYDKDALSAAELCASLSAKEKFFYDYLTKGVVVKLVQHDFEQTALRFYQMRVSAEGAWAPDTLELFQALGAVRQKQLNVEYAITDEKAAKAAADAAKNWAVRDQAMFDQKQIGAADLGMSLAAKEKAYYEYVAKGIAVRIARIELEQARLFFKQKAQLP